jgi:hypothetical protein
LPDSNGSDDASQEHNPYRFQGETPLVNQQPYFGFSVLVDLKNLGVQVAQQKFDFSHQCEHQV